MQDISERLAEIMQPVLSDFSAALKESAEKSARAEAERDAFRREYGDFVGSVLYLEKLKGGKQND